MQLTNPGMTEIEASCFFEELRSLRDAHQCLTKSRIDLVVKHCDKGGELDCIVGEISVKINRKRKI